MLALSIQVVDLEKLENLAIGSNTFINATTAVFTFLPNVTQLTINEGSLNAVETLQLNGVGSSNKTEIKLTNNTLSNLKVISIGEEEDTEMAEVLLLQTSESVQETVMVTTAPVLPAHTALIVDCTELVSLPSDIKTLLFANESCATWNSTELDLRRFVYLQVIDIGSDALVTVTTILATGLRNLVQMEVGEGSLISVTRYVEVTKRTELICRYIS